MSLLRGSFSKWWTKLETKRKHLETSGVSSCFKSSKTGLSLPSPHFSSRLFACPSRQLSCLFPISSPKVLLNRTEKSAEPQTKTHQPTADGLLAALAFQGCHCLFASLGKPAVTFLRGKPPLSLWCPPAYKLKARKGERCHSSSIKAALR